MNQHVVTKEKINWAWDWRTHAVYILQWQLDDYLTELCHEIYQNSISAHVGPATKLSER